MSRRWPIFGCQIWLDFGYVGSEQTPVSSTLVTSGPASHHELDCGLWADCGSSLVASKVKSVLFIQLKKSPTCIFIYNMDSIRRPLSSEPHFGQRKTPKCL